MWSIFDKCSPSMINCDLYFHKCALIMSRDKRAKFRELAENRVNKAVKSIELIGNLSNTRNYEYSEAEVRKIFKYIELSLTEAHAKFSENIKKQAKTSFKL